MKFHEKLLALRKQAGLSQEELGLELEERGMTFTYQNHVDPATMVIADAEQLAAEAFGAAHAFLMVGGTTSAVQSMVLTAVKRG